ncbi:MAG: hypothetical protein JO180_08375 [Gemmatirosa sp.]|nr:hypothetical protein [Gemmatirosa sp.]
MAMVTRRLLLAIGFVLLLPACTRAQDLEIKLDGSVVPYGEPVYVRASGGAPDSVVPAYLIQLQKQCKAPLQAKCFPPRLYLQVEGARDAGVIVAHLYNYKKKPLADAGPAMSRAESRRVVRSTETTLDALKWIVLFSSMYPKWIDQGVLYIGVYYDAAAKKPGVSRRHKPIKPSNTPVFTELPIQFCSPWPAPQAAPPECRKLREGDPHATRSRR